MPNLVRLIVLPSKGDNSGAVPPADVAALAQALDAVTPRSQLDLGDPYYNSAGMHQSFKQKLEAVPPATALVGSVIVEPAYRFAHEVNVANPNVWTNSVGTGGGVVYQVNGTSWYLGIRFQ
jgi:hypothetical protein